MLNVKAALIITKEARATQHDLEYLDIKRNSERERKRKRIACNQKFNTLKNTN